MTSFNKLKTVPVNKTLVFYSPIEGDDVLVRTGTIAEGSCFFHALLHAVSSEYSGMNKSGRMKFVRKLRASLAGKVDKETWEEMGNGILSKIPFQENVHSILTNFYKFILNVNGTDKIKGKSTRRIISKFLVDDKDFDLFVILLEIVSLQTLEQDILPKAYNATANKKIKTSCKEIINQIINYLDSSSEFKSLSETQQDLIAQKMIKFITAVQHEAEKEAFEHYVKSLENVHSEIDSSTLELISNRFNRDIYFLNASTRLPYNYCPNLNIKNRRSVIILWIDDNHYEIVGRLLPGNRIQREFATDDVIIQKFKDFLFDHENFLNKYPELTEYLNKNTNNQEEQDSDSDVESDPYYDSSEHGSPSRSRQSNRSRQSDRSNYNSE